MYIHNMPIHNTCTYTQHSRLKVGRTDGGPELAVLITHKHASASQSPAMQHTYSPSCCSARCRTKSALDSDPSNVDCN